MPLPRLHAVIMAGGSGTRFWPASRKSRPKQFLPIAGAKPMLTTTVERLAGLVELDRVLVVCGAGHVDLVRSSLPDLPRANVLAEPVARNTAPCVAWAALEVERREPDGVQIVLPADHAIEPAEAFRKSLAAAAVEASESSRLVTLGIRPTHPATGYGYIEAGDLVRRSDGHAIHKVARFVEKPDRARAQTFLDSGRFFWNGGIFVWRTKAILEALERYAPEIVGKLRAAEPAARAATYPGLPSTSVDVAVMERAAADDRVRLVPIAYRWSDVGSWSALPEVHALDAGGNCAAGGTRLVAEDAQGCIAWGDPGTLTAVIGVENLMVVRAGEATLVCPRDRAEDVRKIVAALERDGSSAI